MLLTIEIPDREEDALLNYIQVIGSKVIKRKSVCEIKKSQLASLERGLKETVLISRGEITGAPLSQLWEE